MGLFTRVRGIEILRTSPFGHSRKSRDAGSCIAPVLLVLRVECGTMEEDKSTNLDIALPGEWALR
jgi:hypothetical protein